MTVATFYPTAYEDGSNPWSAGQANIYADDDSWATCVNPSKNTNYEVIGTTFKQSGSLISDVIPDGATINSVVITAVHKHNTNDTSGPQFWLVAYDGGSTIGTGSTDTSGQTTEETYTYDGTTPSLAQLRSSTFKVGAFFRRSDNTSTHIHSLDYIKVVVDYTTVTAVTKTLAPTYDILEAVLKALTGATAPVTAIAGWNLDTGYAATTEDALLTAGAIANGSFATFTRSLISGADYAIEAGSTAVDASEAISESQYFQFTLTPDSGYELNLYSLVFDGARGGSTGTRGYVVRSSVDSYAANLASADFVGVVPTFDTVTVDLSDAAFQGLSAITFRIYGYSSSGSAYTLAYDDIVVNGSVGRASAGMYVIKNLVTKALSPDYDILTSLTAVAKTLTPSYDIIEQIAKLLSPDYDVRELVTKLLAPDYELLTLVSQTVSPAYDVRELVGVTLIPDYDVRELVTKLLSPGYDVRELVLAELTPDYDVLNLVSRALSPTYNLRELVTAAISPEYDIIATLTAVSKAITPTYNLRELVTKDVSPDYDIHTVISRTLSPDYDVFEAVQKAISPAYNVREAVRKDLSPDYDIRVVIFSDISPAYNVLNLVQQVLSPSYDILSGDLTQVEKTISPTYDVRELVARAISPEYDLLTLVEKTVSPEYDVLTLVGKDVTPDYAIRELVTKLLIPDYEIVQHVARTLSPTYDILALVGKTLSPDYDVLTKVPVTLSPDYDIRQRVRVILHPVYRILTVVVIYPRCDQCLTILGSQTYSYDGYTFCSPGCLRGFRANAMLDRGRRTRLGFDVGLGGVSADVRHDPEQS